MLSNFKREWCTVSFASLNFVYRQEEEKFGMNWVRLTSTSIVLIAYEMRQNGYVFSGALINNADISLCWAETGGSNCSQEEVIQKSALKACDILLSCKANHGVIVGGFHPQFSKVD